MTPSPTACASPARDCGRSCRHILFKVSQLIADKSSGLTLEPGDVIATGSPQGDGVAMTLPHVSET
ncbi:fumarylacetoacetate hydrolase family protein [Rhodococcus sp. NPDC055024]